MTAKAMLAVSLGLGATSALSEGIGFPVTLGYMMGTGLRLILLQTMTGHYLGGLDGLRGTWGALQRFVNLL